MKMNFKILLLLLLIGAVPYTVASGQEKKNEKKIKVVIDNGTGEKTVLDTIITGESFPETITTKDGKVIFIEKHGSHSEHGKGEKMMHVTVSDDVDGERETTEKIIIMSDDGESLTTTSTGDAKKHIQVYADAEAEGDGPVKHFVVTTTGDKNGTWTSKADGNVYVITKAESVEADTDGDKVEVRVESGDIETESGETRYIIAKDGVVVTVESNDEAKAKELIKEIESKLGVKKEKPETKEAEKAESEKGVKK